MEIKIEKGVPMPKRAAHLKKHQNFPFEQMDIGDSFKIPCQESEIKKLMDVVNSRFKREFADKKIVTRKETGGLRVWRTA